MNSHVYTPPSCSHNKQTHVADTHNAGMGEGNALHYFMAQKVIHDQSGRIASNDPSVNAGGAIATPFQGQQNPAAGSDNDLSGVLMLAAVAAAGYFLFLN